VVASCKHVNNNKNDKAFKSQASWVGLEMKPTRFKYGKGKPCCGNILKYIYKKEEAKRPSCRVNLYIQKAKKPSERKREEKPIRINKEN
jgi:hypothetical protein